MAMTTLHSKIDEMLEDYADQYAELEIASFSKAQYLEEIKLLTAETKSAILKSVYEEVLKVAPDIDKHYCPFNDGEQVCECFAECKSKFKSNLKLMIGGKE